MKLGPVIKPDKSKKKKNAKKKRFDLDAMSAKCDAIVIFPNYSQSGAIRKPDFERIDCKTYNFIQ